MLHNETETAPQRDVLTDFEIAERTGFSVHKVRRLMKAGEIPGGKLGGEWRVPTGVWQQFVNGTWERRSA